MDQQQLQHFIQLCLDEIKADLQEIKAKIKNETIYACGFGIVEDITGFFTVINSVEALNEMVVNEEDFNGYAWFPSEWKYSSEGTRAIYDFLEPFLDEIETDEAYEDLRQQYEQCLLNALAQCRDEGLFKLGPQLDEVLVFVSYVDDYNDDEIANRSSKRLNSPEQHQIFKQRFKLKRKALA